MSKNQTKLAPLQGRGPAVHTQDRTPQGSGEIDPLTTAFLVSTCRIQWYGEDHNPEFGRVGGRDHRPRVACGQQHTIEPDTVFRSKAQLRALGLSEKHIDDLVSSGALVPRTTEGMFRQQGSGRPTSAQGVKAPIVLGNTLGNPDDDKAAGLEHGRAHENNAGAKFGWNPENLTGRDLDELQAIVASTDPSITPPDSIDACIEILSQDFRG